MDETTVIGAVTAALSELRTIADACIGREERAACALCRAKAALEEAVELLDGSMVLTPLFEDDAS